MTRDQFEATLIQARKFGGFGLDPYFESMRVHDAEQRAEIARLRAALNVWQSLFRQAGNVAGGLTHYVEDRP